MVEPMRFFASPQNWLRGLLACAVSAGLPVTAQTEQSSGNGRALYQRTCFLCHQINGQGMPRVYPPLAKSDFLLGDTPRAIRILCEGLSGEITVNSKKFDGVMPPVTLNDQEVADVLNYVRNSWGNQGESVTADTVKEVRAKTSFPTFEKLMEASSYPPLPSPPEGFTLREVVRLPFQATRMLTDPTGKFIYLLHGYGDVSVLDPVSGQLRQILWSKNFLLHRPDDSGPPLFVLGLAMDKQNRLYIAANQGNNATVPYQNVVTIYRTSGFTPEGDPTDPKPWFETNYPGNSAYVHAVENIAFGPDGLLYIGNGARTDANQSGGDPHYYQGGETPITSSFWRVNPADDRPILEVFARGIRNAYGFCWNDKGELFATENGPDADAPEELNFVEKGKHYGFPYTFSNWGKKKAYPHTPDAPPGLEFTLPIANLGPDGGYKGEPLYTFDPHSSPGGIVFLGDDFPEGWRGTFLLTRFGNFLGQGSVGFDLLHATLKKNAAGIYEGRFQTVLAPLGRPIDVHLLSGGRVYVCEYSRATKKDVSFAMPGRIIELAVKPNVR
jgi:glucose/arabinose dehydrogenase/mono/diheme cytochrome c family protein